MMKKIISLLIVGMLNSSLIVGCQSTQEVIEEEEVKIEVSQERYLEIINEINAEYGNENFIAKGYESSIKQNEYITFQLYTEYIYDPLNDDFINTKQERIKVINEMREINRKLNEKYNEEGVRITSIIMYGKDGKCMIKGKKQRCEYVIYGDNTEEDKYFLE